MSFYLKHLIMT